MRKRAIREKMKKTGLLTFLTLLCAVGLFGCANMIAQRMAAPKATTEITPAPTNEEDYASIPFQKAASPAFIDEVAGRWIRYKVEFIGVQTMVMDLPREYQSDWVRFLVQAPGGGSSSMNHLIPKENASQVFDLSEGDVIEIFAQVLKVETGSAISGRAQSSSFFRVAKIRKE